MEDGRKNNSGTKGNNGGNPGYGKMSFIKDKVKKHSGPWWDAWEEMMHGNDKTDKRFAMSEFNKLQTKMIPQDVDMAGAVVIEVAKQIADKHEDHGTPRDTGESSRG